MNTTAQHLKLANGGVSKLILSTAGPQIQAECQQLAPSGLAFGSVIETSGYNLPCRKVYHGACQNWDGGAGACEAVSGQCSMSCIVTATISADNRPKGLITLLVALFVCPSVCLSVCLSVDKFTQNVVE